MQPTYKQPDRTEKTCAILRATNDGDDLSSNDLSLVQSAVNRNLTEEGIRLFDELHQQVTAGTYHRPYLFDIPGLSQDLEGYILWQEKYVIEHFTWHDEASAARLRIEALELADRCRVLEVRQIVPSISTVLNDALFA